MAALLTLCAAVLASVACSEIDEGANGPTLSLNNCTSCHTSEVRLVATADPEPPDTGEDPGEG